MLAVEDMVPFEKLCNQHAYDIQCDYDSHHVEPHKLAPFPDDRIVMQSNPG